VKLGLHGWLLRKTDGDPPRRRAGGAIDNKLAKGRDMMRNQWLQRAT